MRRRLNVLLAHRQAVLILLAILLLVIDHAQAQSTAPAATRPNTTSTSPAFPTAPSIPSQCAECPHSTQQPPLLGSNSSISINPGSNNNTAATGTSSNNDATAGMTCYLNSQCVLMQYLCDPALGGADCDDPEGEAPPACGADGICYSTNNLLPLPSPGRGVLTADQCIDGYYVALVGNKYTRSCLTPRMQPATECYDWEYSYRGYCVLATCNATAPCGGDYICRNIDPTTQAGVCKHPSDRSDSGSNGTNDDDGDDGDRPTDHYSTQDLLMEGLLIGTSSVIFGGLVGACFWYRKRRREQRIQWEQQGHGSRHGSLSSTVLGVVDGQTKGSRFLPSWIERRWRNSVPAIERDSGDDGINGGSQEEGDGTITGRRVALTMQRSSSNDRSSSIDDFESHQDTRLSYGRHNIFSARRWFWNLDGIGGGGGIVHGPRQSTVIGMLDIAPDIDPPPMYTNRPEPGLPTYNDVADEGRSAEEGTSRSAAIEAATTVTRPEAAAVENTNVPPRARASSVGSSRTNMLVQDTRTA